MLRVILFGGRCAVRPRARHRGCIGPELSAACREIILPFGPASGTDIAARLIGDRPCARWGKPVVIENRPGGDGLVAINAFVSANDDHTLLWVPVGTFCGASLRARQRCPTTRNRDLLPHFERNHAAPCAFRLPVANVGSFREFFELVRNNPGIHMPLPPRNADFLMSGFLKKQQPRHAKVP